MRSELIFGALTHVSNRYQLCQLASKATRKLHKPNSRLQDTTNEVLYRFRTLVPWFDFHLLITVGDLFYFNQEQYETGYKAKSHLLGEREAASDS